MIAVIVLQNMNTKKNENMKTRGNQVSTSKAFTKNGDPTRVQ